MSLFKKVSPEVKQYKKELRSMFPKAMAGKVSLQDVYDKLEEGVQKDIITQEEFNAIIADMSDSIDKSMRLQRVIREKSFSAIKEKYQEEREGDVQ